MATYYWVNTSSVTTSWNTGSNWSTSSGGAPGAVAPTSSDDAVIDDNSGRVGNPQTITTDGSSVCRSFTVTSRTRGSITFSGSQLQIFGSISISATGGAFFSITTWWLQGSASNTISSGVNIPSLFIDGTGTWTQTSSITLFSNGASQLFRLNRGSYITSGFSLTTSGISSVNTNTRTLNISSSTVTLKGSEPVAVTSTNLTYTDSSSAIINDPSALSAFSTVTFAGGGLTYNSVTLTTPPSRFTLIGQANFATLTLNATSAGYTYFDLNSDITISTSLICSGSSASQRGVLRSDTYNTARTVTAASTTLTNFDFSDITAAGAGSWSGTRLGNAKGNTGITFPAAKTVYWSFSGNALWTDNAWSASSGGAPSVNEYPLPQDTAIFDDAGVTAGALVEIKSDPGAFNLPNVSTTAVTGARAFTINGGSSTLSRTIYLYGHFETNANTTIVLAGQRQFLFSARTTQNVAIPNGPANLAFYVQYASTVNLTGNLAAGLIGVGRGSSAGTATFTANSFNVTTGSYTQASNTNSFGNLGTGTWTITGSGTAWSTPKNTFGPSTVSGGSETIYMSGTGASIFIGGSQTFGNLYNDVSNASGLQISDSNTFSSIRSTSNTRAFNLVGGTTTTVTTFIVNGSGPSNRVSIFKTGGGANPILTKASGEVRSQYLSLTNTTATGGATWIAVDSLNNGGNTGWIFVSSSTGFFLFF